MIHRFAPPKFSAETQLDSALDEILAFITNYDKSASRIGNDGFHGLQR